MKTAVFPNNEQIQRYSGTNPPSYHTEPLKFRSGGETRKSTHVSSVYVEVRVGVAAAAGGGRRHGSRRRGGGGGGGSRALPLCKLAGKPSEEEPRSQLRIRLLGYCWAWAATLGGFL